MKILLIILALLAVAGGVYFFLLKSNRIKDEDGNMIPDSVDETVAKARKQATLVKEEIKEKTIEVKRRAKRVAEETKDVVAAVKEVAKQSKDVVDAAKGTPRKGRKPAAKKAAPKVEKTVVVESKPRKRNTKK